MLDIKFAWVIKSRAQLKIIQTANRLNNLGKWTESRGIKNKLVPMGGAKHRTSLVQEEWNIGSLLADKTKK